MISEEDKEAIKSLEKEIAINGADKHFNRLKRNETLLNLISKLQKENEELKDYQDRTKHTIKIAKMHRKDNEKLKKVIDLMARAIFYEDNSNQELRKLSTCIKIKEYFYKKVEVEDE